MGAWKLDLAQPALSLSLTPRSVTLPGILISLATYGPTTFRAAGEPPHGVLVNHFITPSEIFYVRNHLPVPANLSTVDTHKLVIEADPQFNLFRAELTVQDLKAKFEQVTLTVTLQCAGNRRNDMCAIETVSGRAPWNAGEEDGVLL